MGEGCCLHTDPRREPIFNLPNVILFVIGCLVLIHAFRYYILTDDLDDELVAMLAYVPARLTFYFDPDRIADVLSHLPVRTGALETAQFFLGDGNPRWATLVTYSFLHADWTHVGINSIWLAAFGTPVARRIGAFRFILFYMLTAIAGALSHSVIHLDDFTPMIGASAAVSAAMGASIRFIFTAGGPLSAQPSNEFDEEASQSRRAPLTPLLPLSVLLQERRVVLFILVWLIVNLAFGLLSGPLNITNGTIAWEAHTGGFLAGLLFFPWFDRAPRRVNVQA
ncbi:MAG: rhomboid family intramembrane serine protease [Alphaproteobacteria bacterium]|nr:rhomboid family intramembrane serine protease [Alphaproteobacteria bacterium]